MVIGPFLFPPVVFAVLVGIIFLMIASALLKKYLHPSFDSWVGLLVLFAFVAARLGFVVRHWDSYQEDPLRVLFIWQGGFDWLWAVVAALLSILYLKTWRYRAIGLGTLLSAALVMLIAFNLTPSLKAKDLPDFELVALSQTSINLDASDSEYTVLNLWATWCGPCRREMPALQQAISDYPMIDFYLINQGEPIELVQQYLEAEGLQLDSHVLLDPNYQVANYYKTLGTPVTLFFKNKALMAQHVGEISVEVLSDRLRQLTLDSD